MALGFGIVGCGMISNFHAKAIADVRGAKLISCFDHVRPSGERFAAENNIDLHDDLKTMLADDRLDVVTICTPRTSGV